MEDLFQRRSERGLTMRQVADAAQITEGYYCLIEHGERRPSVFAAQRIAKILGFDWTEFFKEKNEG